MKKTYIFLLALSIFTFGFSQTIVTVDRANIIGPTVTGNATSISSSGLVRGAGVNRATNASANYTSNNWIGTTEAEAITNDDYIEWSTTSNAFNEIDVTGIDIRMRRNANGPSNWRIFYSLDNFATAGIAAIPEQTTTSTTANIYNFPSLSINSGISGTITFRLYAWNANTAAGWVRIANRASWSAFGVASPGIRLNGTVTTTVTNSIDSDIVASTNAFFPVQSNIDYNSTYITASGLDASNSVPLGAFTIRDGGSSTDTDSDATTLNSIEFIVANHENLAALAIIDITEPTPNIAEVTTVTASTVFSGFNLTAPDNGSKQFIIFGSFKSTVTDNDQIQLTINNVTAAPTGSSFFTEFDASGAQTSTAGDDNRIEVTASKFEFVQQPQDGNMNEVLVPHPTIIAVDANSNIDLDEGPTTINVASSAPSSSIVAETYTMTDGFATLNNVVFLNPTDNINLIASSAGLSGTSATFDIKGPLITIAQQDFDGSTPDWPYTNTITQFDNGWGTDGYYGVINNAIATPLDNPNFSNNIFGENDLNDEGDNGTSGFATITFATTDISDFNNVKLKFDWDIHGYNANNDDAQYRLIYDGVNQPYVFLLNGNDAVETDEGRISLDIPDSVNTFALQIRVRNNGLNGYSGFDNFRLVSEFNGLIYTSAGGWKDNVKPDGTTGAQDALVLNGTYDVSGNIEIDNFIINEGASTVLDFGESLTTNSNLVNIGDLELNSISNSYSSLIVNGSVANTVTYHRNVNQFADTGSTTGKNDLVSAPVTNASQTFGVLRATNTQIPSRPVAGDTEFLFGPFDNISNTYTIYTTADDTSLIEAGIGYRTASAPTASTFEFVGDVKTGTVNVPITIGTGSIQNLIGNPYPSYISLSTFISVNHDAFSTSNYGVYGYVGDFTEGFKVFNASYVLENPNAKIAPGQGFFVASKTASETISFTPAMRTIGASDDFISGRPANLNSAHLTLKVNNNDSSYSTDLYFNDHSSLSMDIGYDSEMLGSTAPEFSIYSHLVEDNIGKNMAVQSVAYADLENVTIPLGVNVAQGEQTIVSISESNIPEGTIVTLEDNTSNTFTNLQEGDYTFTPSTSLTDTGRFFLHFSTEALLGDTDHLLSGLQIYAQSKTIVIKGQLDSATTFTLFDVQGRKVNTQVLNSKNTEHTIDSTNLSAGIYVVQLLNNAGSRTQKVIIR